MEIFQQTTRVPPADEPFFDEYSLIEVKILIVRIHKLTILVFLIASLSPIEIYAQHDFSALEKNLVRTAHNVDPAVVGLFYSERNVAKFGIVGTGFFVNSDGYFVTAAHVLKNYKADSSQMTAQIRQSDGNMNGQ